MSAAYPSPVFPFGGASSTFQDSRGHGGTLIQSLSMILLNFDIGDRK